MRLCLKFFMGFPLETPVGIQVNSHANLNIGSWELHSCYLTIKLDFYELPIGKWSFDVSFCWIF